MKSVDDTLLSGSLAPQVSDQEVESALEELSEEERAQVATEAEKGRAQAIAGRTITLPPAASKATSTMLSKAINMTILR